MRLSLNNHLIGEIMFQLSTNFMRLLTLLFVFGALSGTAQAADSSWPLTVPIDLSSGFGDYRTGHFHFGIDLRTGGLSGKTVVSPVDGYVWRIRTEYTGYGKALYIKGDDGYTYVLAHLANFYDPYDAYVKKAQVASKRYFQDLYPPPDSLRVKAGRPVAVSGQTGSGAPHLHFEKRRGDTPLNPLSHGYRLDDTTPPVFARVGFKLADDHSVMFDGVRKVFLDVTPGASPNSYTLDTLLYFNSPFGLLTDVFDRMRSGGMRQAVYDLALYIDDKLYYRSRFDSLDFATNYSVSREYDYLEAVDKEKSVRRLYQVDGNDYHGSGAAGDHGGVFGMTGAEQPGPHRVRIVAVDAYGNTSELAFTFLWGRRDSPVYTLDSTVRVATDTTLFTFSPIRGYKRLGIDSAVVYLNRANLWGATPNATVTALKDGRIQVRAIGAATATTALRLVVFTGDGGVIDDVIFSGLMERGTGRPHIRHEILEDGLLVTLDVGAIKSSKGRVEFYWRDTLLGIEPVQMLNMNKYVCFVPPQRKYSRIDRIHAAMGTDTTFKGVVSDSLNIAVVGLDDREDLWIGEHLRLLLGRATFFEPCFVELEEQHLLNRSKLGLNSNTYRLMPEAMATREAFEISYEIPWPTVADDKSGLCWLDEDKNRWIWLDNTGSDHTLTASSVGGGVFVALFDYEAPAIKYLSVRDGGVYHKLQPAINFVIEDTLSGIGDDRDILIELDGEWLIPEYEPETGRVTSRPLQPLTEGRHHLGIVVTDRVGNKTEQYLNFTIAKRRGRTGVNR